MRIAALMVILLWLFSVPVVAGAQPLRSGDKIPLAGLAFGRGDEKLSASKEALDSAARFIAGHPEAVFEIGCHRGPKGTDSANRAMTARRAKQLYDSLISRGVRMDRLVWKGYGESQLPGKRNAEVTEKAELKVLQVLRSCNDTVFNTGDVLRIGWLIFGCDARLRYEIRDSLEMLAQFVKNHPGLSIEVACYTDSRGTDAFNEKLANARAKQIYEYLLQQGVYPPRLTWKGYGEKNPIAGEWMITAESDKTKRELLCQLNRRQELRIIAVNESGGH